MQMTIFILDVKDLSQNTSAVKQTSKKYTILLRFWGGG